MSAPPYMKLYVADYLAETTHLNATENGAYLLLLMAMWRAGGKLPRDEVKLAKIARVSPEQWAEIGPTVLEFFTVAGGLLKHKRVAKEIARYQRVVDGSKKAGKASAAKRANKNSDLSPTDVGDDVQRKTNQPKPEPELESQVVLFPERGEKAEPQESRSKARGSRLDARWTPSRAHRLYAEQHGFAPAEIDRMAEDFRDFWAAKPGRDGVKTDWEATWRRWVRTQADRRPKPQASKQVDWC